VQTGDGSKPTDWKSAVVADISLQVSFCACFLVFVHVFVVLYFYFGSQRLLLTFCCSSLSVNIFWSLCMLFGF